MWIASVAAALARQVPALKCAALLRSHAISATVRSLRWLAALVVAVAVFVAVAKQVRRARDRGLRDRCVTNLKQIAQAMLLYANAHGNCYPDSWSALARDRELSPALFVCPADYEISPAADAASIDDAHSSYRLIADSIPRGHDYSGSMSGLYMPAVETPGRHGERTLHAIFNDGHVRRINLSERRSDSWREVQREWTSGHGPVDGRLRWPASQPVR